MKLSELVHKTWEDERVRELKIRKDHIKVIIDVMIEQILKGLMDGAKVKLRGLFTLGTKEIKGRSTKHPKTGEDVWIDNYYKVTIEPSKPLRDVFKKMKSK